MGALELADPQGERVLAVGLTGGIATGKSSVAGMLREARVPVVDADQIVHDLLAPGGAAVEPVAERFGQAVLADDGSIDRAALGERVFGDPRERRDLERIVHPLVHDASRAALARLAARPGARIVVYDAALLVETGRHEEFDRLVVVAAGPDVQLARLIKRDGLTADAAGARIRSQHPLAAKVAHADYVIDNSGRWDETRRQVSRLVASLEEDADALRAGRPLPQRPAAR